MSPSRSSDVSWWAVVVLSLTGLGVSTYLTILHFSGSSPACGPFNDCDEVLASSYAVVLGVPVAVLGMAVYATLLFGGLTVLGTVDAPFHLKAAITAVAGLGFAFSLWLTAAQRFLIHAFCPYCLTSATIMTLILVLTAASTLHSRSAHDV